MWTVPRAGQLGFHRRTEYGKQIIKIGADGKEVTPKGGFHKYGVIKGPYIVLRGSIPGHVKRLIRLRHSVRAPEEAVKPEITYLKV
jgi:large subunit ribosomal protein L3